MKRVVWGAVAATAMAVTTGPVTAQSTFGMAIHMTPATYGGCDDIDDTALDCESIVTAGNTLQADNFAWLMVFKWDQAPGWPTDPEHSALGAARFGINYDDTVFIPEGGWTLCTGGLQIPEDDFLGTWPASGTGNAVTWSPPNANPNQEKIAKVGFFFVPVGSFGRITLQSDPRLLGTSIELVNGSSDPANTFLFEVGPETFSSANVDGGSPDLGRNACLEAVPQQKTSWGELKSLF